MKIGELAERTGLAPSRIRFYERIGLLKAAERQPNGYRSYAADAVLVLNVIATAQQAGFSLEELRTLLPPDLEEWDHDTLVDTLRKKVQDIEAMQARLAQSRTHILALMQEIEARPAEVDCATNAKRVLSKVREVAGQRNAERKTGKKATPSTGSRPAARAGR